MNRQYDFADFLETVPAFAEFTGYELSILERAMVVDEYPDGYVFLDEGRHEEFMYLIIDGEVSATHAVSMAGKARRAARSAFSMVRIMRLRREKMPFRTVKVDHRIASPRWRYNARTARRPAAATIIEMETA